MLEQANAGLAQLNGKLRAELAALKAQQVGQKPRTCANGEPCMNHCDDGEEFHRCPIKRSVVLPEMPTEQMMAAYRNHSGHWMSLNGWRAMLEVAPQPAPSQDVAGVLEPGKIVVSAEPLRRVLNALVNAPHRIRELQVTREPVELFANNPINILIAEFEAAHDKQSGVGRE